MPRFRDVVDVKGKYVYLAARNLVFGSLTRSRFWAALQVTSKTRIVAVHAMRV
jgi:hypothetical protein